MLGAFLTVDWDYFVPEKLDWEFFQEEKRLYLSTAWKRRIKYFREMRTDGKEVNFWDFPCKKNNLPYYISDSHLAAYELKELHDSDVVVIVDAHHDIFKIDNPDSPDCGTWLAFWLKGNKNRHVYWVKPSHSICVDPVGFEDQITIVHSMWDVPPLNYKAIHVCRSGCWTPPWTDAAFIRFVKEYRKTYKLLGENWCNPMKKRWGLADYRDAFQIQEQNTDCFRYLSKTPVPMEFVVDFKKENYRFL